MISEPQREALYTFMATITKGTTMGVLKSFSLVSIQSRRHSVYIAHAIFSTCWVCVPLLLDCPHSLHTRPLSAPVLNFRQGPVCSQLWQPATLLFLAPSCAILETSELFAASTPLLFPIPLRPGCPLKASRWPHVQTEAFFNSLSRGKVQLCLSATLRKTGRAKRGRRCTV